MRNRCPWVLPFRTSRRSPDEEHGQILVIFALMIVVLLGAAAIVVDLGLLRTDRARLQNALDSGALAAGHYLPATSTNVASVTSTANSYVSSNFAGAPAPTVDYRCLIGFDTTTGLPRVTDMPAVCYVLFAATDTHWRCTATACWAPCNPAATSTDVCNTINLSGSATRNFGFGRAVGVNSGSTGSATSAVCSGLCGQPPTVPLDTVMVVDRTISMGNNRNMSSHPADSAATAGVRSGADQVLSIFNPAFQRLAFGALGLSSTVDASAAYGACTATPAVKVGAMHIGSSVGVTAGASATNTNEGGGSIGFRRATSPASTVASSTSLSITSPTGTLADDVLIATIAVSGVSSVGAAPAGWTAINSQANTSAGTGLTVASFYRVLTAPAAASYSFSWSGSHAAVGAILAYTGLDTTAPIDNSGATSNSTGTNANVRANAITTGYDNSLVVGVFGTIGASATFTAPAGMTERVDYRVGTNPTVEIADEIQATAGSTGNNQATASASGRWTAYQFALKAGPSASLAISRPTGTSAGDVLVAAVSVDGGSGTSISAPSGWTLIQRTNNSSTIGVASYYRVAGAGEPASYTWTIGGSMPAAGSISAYSNVSVSNVLDPATASENTGNGTTLTANSVATTATYTQVVAVYATVPSTTFTAGSGMALEASARYLGGGPSMMTSNDQVITAGNTGNKTATATSGVWAAQLFGLRSNPVDVYSIDVNDSTALEAWIPVGFTGLDTDSPGFATAGMRGHNEAYSASGVVDHGSSIAQGIECFDQASWDGTNLATPVRMATKYLQLYGRSDVAKAIILETDGTPQSCPSSLSTAICNEYTSTAAQTAADAADAAGISLYTIGYGTGIDATLLGNMASTKFGSSLCNSAENTDGDTFFCAPTAADLNTVFQYVAESLARGPHLVQLYPQPVVTSVSPSTGSRTASTNVTITGSYFTEAYSVTIGGTAVTSFTVNSDTQITAKLPTWASTGIQDLVVSTPGGSSKVVTGDRFTYTP